MAVAFAGQTFTFTQPDGTTLEVRGWGSQNYAVFETLDGYTVTRNPATGFWEVAQRSADGTRLEPVSAASSRPDGGRGLVPRGVRIDPESARAAGRESAMRFGGRRCDERWRERKAHLLALRTMAAAGGPAMAPPQRETVGDFVGLCLLIDFSDVPASISRDEVERFCNQVGYSGFGNNGSVRDYFHENSLGRLRYTNIVMPYYRAAHPKSYYTDPAVPMGARARELIREALQHWKDAGVDFSLLTPDSAGFVYATNVFYAGPVVNNWSEGLWPHAWSLGSAVSLAPGRSAFDYQVTAIGSQLLLGTFCHENGHMLCDYPDLYDYGNESAGVGMFCLMCAGNHADQRNPVHISAYLKRLSGWASSVANLEHGATVTLRAGQNEFAMFARSNDEYFLIENRARTGRDAALPGEGIAVWHVDELGSNNNEQMIASSHYELSLEQADGLFELERSRFEIGDAGDLFFGAAARFGGDTVPDSRWWDGTSSHLVIDSVSALGQAMTFRCTFSNVVGPGTGVVKKESAPGAAIPDADPSGIADAIDIAESPVIADLKVAVDITHSYRGDLEVKLLSPWGAEIILHPRNLGGSDDDLKAEYTAATLPPLGTWRGRSAQGRWQLLVRDLARLDQGTLNRWSLEITPATAAQGPVVLEESTTVAIPENQTGGIERTLVAAATGTIAEVEVDLDITHPYIGDLRVSLVSPAGTVAILHDRTGKDKDNIVKTYTTANTPALAAFAGQPVSGTWRLRVSDNAPRDLGDLNAWRVRIRLA